MYKILSISTIFIIFISLKALSQSGIIEGWIYDKSNKEPLPFSNVLVVGTETGSMSDFAGKFVIAGIKPGFYKLKVSSLGYETVISTEIQVMNNKTSSIEIMLKKQTYNIEEVVVSAAKFEKKEESPVSLRTLELNEIENSPGANRDISKVLQILPGIAALPGQNRNDIIVRGGASNESKFYLDDVEIPIINHFTTQGASGGSNGILNANFIRNVDFYSGAFPSNRGNALSGIFDFKQIDGNSEKAKFNGTIGASELAITVDGPISNNTTYIISARRSYLQFLFKFIGLPFLPTFNDYQLKVKTKIDKRNEISLISIGALDQFSLDKDMKNPDEFQSYILNYLPVYEQWSYTIGAVYKNYYDFGFHTVVLSRNMFNYNSYKYFKNIEADNNLIFNYNSQEIENKIRYENNIQKKYKIVYGLNFEQGINKNESFQKIFTNNIDTVAYNSDLSLYKYGLFSQISNTYFDNRLSASLGIRFDGNSYSKSMSNLLEQFSPRFSLSYLLNEKINLDFNTGRYYQIPTYTTLGYSFNNEFINKKNGLKYISSDHLIFGGEYFPKDLIKISLEAFYKYYRNYPFSISDSIPLSDRAADFGVIGNEEVLSTAKGRAYGIEALVQAKFKKEINFILSYTFAISEFAGPNQDFHSSSWDNRHILTTTLSKKIKNNWNLGLKWRFAGGLPYTPYDLEKSSLISAWDIKNQAYFDYSLVNSKRFKTFHQLDIRIDKEIYFAKSSLKLYLDIQNLYNFKSEQLDIITNTNTEGIPEIDSGNPSKYVLREIKNNGAGTILPTIGIIFNF